MTTHENDELDQQITAALDAVPHVAIADDFAYRMMSRVPARPVRTRSLPRRASIGRRVAIVVAGLLLVAMIIFAAPTHDTNQLQRTLVLWAMAAEFVGLTVWLAMRPGEQR